MMQKYNWIFYPNACHVCKCFGKKFSLKRCGNCAMISYCSKEHQRQHWPQHKDLCTAISNVLRDNRASSLLSKEQNYNPGQWTQRKMNFMLLVALAMQRKLEHYEEQMFKFLRACAVCHERNSKILEDCSNCPCISFCKEHKSDIMHKDNCSLLKLCFNLDVTLMECNGQETPKFTIPHCSQEKTLPSNMKDFIRSYITYNKSTGLSVGEEIALGAEHLTRPLTLLFAMQTLGYPKRVRSLTIHVLGANMIEMTSVELWEILLHWLPSILSARIVFIGPELAHSSISSNLCQTCVSKNKQFSLETFGTLYENYAKSSPFSKPDFIIGFNAGIHECEDWTSSRDTWYPSLQIVARQTCPFILTSYTLQEAEKEQDRLNIILSNNTNCTYCAQNPYASLRPYRDFETNNVYYQNQYLIIYKQLSNL